MTLPFSFECEPLLSKLEHDTAMAMVRFRDSQDSAGHVEQRAQNAFPGIEAMYEIRPTSRSPPLLPLPPKKDPQARARARPLRIACRRRIRTKARNISRRERGEDKWVLTGERAEREREREREGWRSNRRSRRNSFTRINLSLSLVGGPRMSNDGHYASRRGPHRAGRAPHPLT